MHWTGEAARALLDRSFKATWPPALASSWRAIRASTFALVALLFLSACATGNNASRSAVGNFASLPPQIEREVGPVYTSRTLQAFVDSVGQKVVASAHLGGRFHFFILDDPIPNAQAVSPSYVFVTRGLLAVIDDEAELAAAFGHELGHLEMHHATQRERLRRNLSDAAIEATVTSGSATVGRLVARQGLLTLRRYSRDQELEADQTSACVTSSARVIAATR